MNCSSKMSSQPQKVQSRSERKIQQREFRPLNDDQLCDPNFWLPDPQIHHIQLWIFRDFGCSSSTITATLYISTDGNIISLLFTILRSLKQFHQHPFKVLAQIEKCEPCAGRISIPKRSSVHKALPDDSMRRLHYI